MLAMTTGTAVPMIATSFLSPLLLLMVLLHTMKTRVPKVSCRHAAMTVEPTNNVVKFEITKNVKAIAPDAIIQRASLFSNELLLSQGVYFYTMSGAICRLFRCCLKLRDDNFFHFEHCLQDSVGFGFVGV